MSHSSHEHRRGLIGNILDFAEGEELPPNAKFCLKCGQKSRAIEPNFLLPLNFLTGPRGKR